MLEVAVVGDPITVVDPLVVTLGKLNGTKC
jgi:hypothetical protein